jgi:hypothetical protein
LRETDLPASTVAVSSQIALFIPKRPVTTT